MRRIIHVMPQCLDKVRAEFPQHDVRPDYVKTLKMEGPHLVDEGVLTAGWMHRLTFEED